MFKSQHSFMISSLTLLSLVLPSTTYADGYSPYTLGANPTKPTQVKQEDSEDVIVLQDEIKDHEERITVLQKDVRQIDRDLERDDVGYGCDCRPSVNLCDEKLFAKLGLDPDSPTSCEDIWEREPNLNRLPQGCRQVVKACKRVDKRRSKIVVQRDIEETRESIKEKKRLLREARRDSRKTRTVVTQVDTQGEPCAECEIYSRQNRGMNFGETMVGLSPMITNLGLGLIGASVYNKGMKNYYNAYNNSANQFYGQAGDYYNNALQMGMPAGPLTYAPPAMYGGGGFGGGGIGGGFGGSPYAMNGYGMNGYNPFGLGLNAGIGIGGGLGNGGFGMGGFPGGGFGMNGGFNSGMNPYGIGVQASMWPYNMGVNSMYSPYGGMNNGIGGGIGIGGGFNGGGYNNPYAGYQYQMQMQQQQQYAYQQQAQAQQMVQQAAYRNQQIMMNGASLGSGYGGYNYGNYGGNAYGGGVGLGINIGIGGSIGFGSGYGYGAPSYGNQNYGAPGYGTSGAGGSTF